MFNGFLILDILFRPFGFLTPKDLLNYWLSNILALSVVYSRNASCALNCISTFLLMSRTFCVLFVFVLFLVYQMLAITLDCPFLIVLRFSLAFSTVAYNIDKYLSMFIYDDWFKMTMDISQQNPMWFLLDVFLMSTKSTFTLSCLIRLNYINVH